MASSGPPQRSTPRRGSKQGFLDWWGREVEPTMSERAEARKKSTMSKKDQELDAKVEAANREYIEMQMAQQRLNEDMESGFRKGGKVKAKKARGDGIVQRGKTRGRFV